MPLLSATLATQLATMLPTESEGEAINGLVTAWTAYFSGASVLGVPPVPGSLDPALTAMRAALVGVSQDGQGAAKIQAAITQFWTTLSPLVTAIWTVPPNVTTPPAIVPTTLGGIAAALTATFSANTSGSLDLAASSNAVASVLHLNGGLGGIVTLTPPLPATPFTAPIL